MHAVCQSGEPNSESEEAYFPCTAFCSSTCNNEQIKATEESDEDEFFFNDQNTALEMPIAWQPSLVCCH